MQPESEDVARTRGGWVGLQLSEHGCSSGPVFVACHTESLVPVTRDVLRGPSSQGLVLPVQDVRLDGFHRGVVLALPL